MRLPLAVVLTLAVCAPARAQSVASPHTTAGSFRGIPDDLEDGVTALASADAAKLAVAGVAATGALHPLDGQITGAFQRAESTAVRHVFKPGRFIGETYVQVAGSLVTYGVGRHWRQPDTQSAGIAMLTAQLLTEGIAEGLKFTTRRQRPDHSNRWSFPSGHAAVTFATATVLQRRFGWAPTVPAYVVASYVAMSRLTSDRHFLTDVVAGAFLGTIVGRAVTSSRGPDSGTPSGMNAKRPARAFELHWSVAF